MKKIITTLLVLKLFMFNDAYAQMRMKDLNFNQKMGSSALGLTLPPLSIREKINDLTGEKTPLLSNLLTPCDTFNNQRFWSLVGVGTASYLGSMTLLQNLWYKQYVQSSFHFFDDQGEWLQMDKAGHVISAYQASKWVYGAMRWSGMKNRNASLFGMAVGTVFQTTLETFDGFSAEWGFSWFDMTANTAGCALFGVQQAVWDEQRMVIKVSNTPRKYPLTPIRSIDGSKTTTFRTRTTDLYGDNYTQTFWKDYNAITIWLSMNPKSFFKESRLPDWLNVAVGYGAENMYGARKNEWPAAKPEFRLSETDYPRYRQYFLSFDIDLSRIKTKSKFLKTLARTINFVKIPSPTLEFNTLGKVKFHPLMF
jgi:hypothetical protein